MKRKKARLQEWGQGRGLYGERRGCWCVDMGKKRLRVAGTGTEKGEEYSDGGILCENSWNPGRR